MVNIQELKQRAEAIRDEQSVNANTAERIGSWDLDMATLHEDDYQRIVDYLSQYTDKIPTIEQIVAELAKKQEILIDGVNIKTVNGQSLLGSGNIEIKGGSTSDAYTKAETDELLAQKADRETVNALKDDVSAKADKTDLDGKIDKNGSWEDTEYVIEEGQGVAPTLAQGKYRFVPINAKDDSAYFRVQGYLYGWSREGAWNQANAEFTLLADTSGVWGCSFHIDTLDGCDGVRIQRYVSVIDEKVDDAVSGKWHTVELLDGVGTYSLHEERVVRFRLLGEGSAYIHYGGGDIVLETSHPEYELYADLSGGFGYETDTFFSIDVCAGGVSQRAEQALYVANSKVDKVSGKGLSTNDYTDADKAKLSELETAVGKKYEKPTDGIPSTDLASSVQTSISRADEIYNDYINAQNLL